MQPTLITCRLPLLLYVEEQGGAGEQRLAPNRGVRVDDGGEYTL